MKRKFEDFLALFRDSIATWNYYVDFEKVYRNTDEIKDELNLLNGLIGVKDISNEFKRIVVKYPQTIKTIPILIAKRDSEIKVNSAEKNFCFNFKKPNYSIDEYVMFMDKSGLFDLLQNHMIHSLVDYVMGVEVGMDTNGRKNRSGDAMEDLIESYLTKCGLKRNVTYFKEMYISDIQRRWNIDLSNISNTGKTEKRFDFVVKIKNTVYGIETNFYSGGGSKLNETARSYKAIALEAKDIKNFKFVWFTDGIGWNSAKHNLEETFDVLDDIYCIAELEKGIMKEIFTD